MLEPLHDNGNHLPIVAYGDTIIPNYGKWGYNGVANKKLAECMAKYTLLIYTPEYNTSKMAQLPPPNNDIHRLADYKTFQRNQCPHQKVHGMNAQGTNSRMFCKNPDPRAPPRPFGQCPLVHPTDQAKTSRIKIVYGPPLPDPINVIPPMNAAVLAAREAESTRMAQQTRRNKRRMNE